MSANLERKAIIDKREGGAFDFEELSMEVYSYQRTHNRIYRQFAELLKRPKSLKSVEDIPFLPISFFKTHEIKSGESWKSEKIFGSSGTTGSQTSRHHIRDLNHYLRNSLKIFESIYGSIKNFQILALLPSYLERDNSSLVAMVNYFMVQSAHEENNFFLHNYTALNKALQSAKVNNQKVLLIGVSFALLDFSIENKSLLDNCIVVETGGMKGKKREMTRLELHAILRNKFGKKKIHSEYGMTELLSQAWSRGDGIFELPFTMDLRFRELTDPLTFVATNKTGVINVIDLLNIDSCAFIATDDLGRRLSRKTFEVLGRVDGSDIRGCNLMYLPTK